MDATPKRRWNQFSLKKLFVVMTLLCIGPGGFVAYEQKKSREQKAAVKALEKLGGRIEYDSSLPSRSTWQRLLLGDDSFANATGLDLSNTRVSDAELAHLRHLSQLRLVRRLDRGDGFRLGTFARIDRAGKSRISAKHKSRTRDSVHVQGLRQLNVLSVQQTQVTDSGVHNVQRAVPKLHINH